MIFEDQLAALAADSKKVGTRGGELDFALLVDGLSAEREQGITIDVAYRFFSTDRRKFIVADTPGHEQYTRNMVTGASTADLAVILIDARKGVLTQTRRHSYLVSLLGIRRVVLAVNKMDLVDYSPRRVRANRARLPRSSRDASGCRDVTCIPISAVHGDNVVDAQRRDALVPGPDAARASGDASRSATTPRPKPFRLPVQWVNRPNHRFPRLRRAQSSAGRCGVGDAVRVLPSGRRARSPGLSSATATPTAASRGQSVTSDAGRRGRREPRRRARRRSDAPPAVADQFEATIVWMHERPMLQGRSYLMKIGTQTVTATVAPLKYKVNVNTLEHVAAKKLELNDIGVCGLELDRPIVVRAVPRQPRPRRVHSHRPHHEQHGRRGPAPLRAAPLAERPLAGARRQQAARAELKGQKPCVLWFTGLSGAGKSTIANLVEKRLHAHGPPHLSARRRQRSSRPEQGPGLHRRGPRREHPPRRRGGAADGRRRA